MSTKNVAGICSFLSSIAIQAQIQKSFYTFWNLHDNGLLNLKLIIIHCKIFENYIDKLKSWKAVNFIRLIL